MTQATLAGALPVPAPEREASLLLRVLLRAVMPLTDLVMAILLFVVTVTGVSLSVGLLPAFLLGIPVFLALGWVTHWLSIAERARLRFFLGLEIAAGSAPPRGPIKALRHAATWRSLGYSLIQFPLGIATFTITIAAWGASVSLLSMPFWLHHVPSRRADLWVMTAGDEPTAWALAGFGVLIAAMAVVLTYALTTLEGELARALLGPTQRDLERRVEQLKVSRSQVVDSVDAERRRIERDLHDGAQQRLVSLAMNLGRAGPASTGTPLPPGSCWTKRTWTPSGH